MPLVYVLPMHIHFLGLYNPWWEAKTKFYCVFKIFGSKKKRQELVFYVAWVTHAAGKQCLLPRFHIRQQVLIAVRWCMDINLFALKGCKRAALVLRCNHQLILSLFSFHWWICSSVCSLLCPLWTTITIHLNSWKGGISKTTFVCLKVGHSFFRKPELIFKQSSRDGTGLLSHINSLPNKVRKEKYYNVNIKFRNRLFRKS